MGKSLNGKELPKGFSQRKNGLYNARKTINGVKIDLYDRDLKTLKTRFAEEEAKIVLGTNTHRKNLKLNEWFKDEWFPTYKASHLKAELNQKNYITRYNSTFGKFLGEYTLSSITELMVQKVANSLIDNDGYSTKYVSNALAGLRECMEAAVSNSLISKNPCICVTVKDDDLVSQRVVMTAAQQKEFLDIAKNRYYSELYQIMLSTGIRVGEMTALKWSDIDIDNKVIHIRHSMQTAYIDGKKIMNMTKPKTDAGIRDIPMFDGVDALFQDWKAKQDSYRELRGERWRIPTEYSDLVFTTTLGSPVTRYVLSEDIKKIVNIIQKNELFMAIKENREPVEFPHIHPHAFRHTFATRCFEKELKPLFIMRIMGHEKYETTLSYTHVLDNSSDGQVKLAGSFVV